MRGVVRRIGLELGPVQHEHRHRGDGGDGRVAGAVVEQRVLAEEAAAPVTRGGPSAVDVNPGLAARRPRRTRRRTRPAGTAPGRVPPAARSRSRRCARARHACTARTTSRPRSISIGPSRLLCRGGHRQSPRSPGDRQLYFAPAPWLPSVRTCQGRRSPATGHGTSVHRVRHRRRRGLGAFPVSGLSIQESLYPELTCFGCGHAQPRRLPPPQLSRWRGDGEPSVTSGPEHDNGFGFLNGGIDLDRARLPHGRGGHVGGRAARVARPTPAAPVPFIDGRVRGQVPEADTPGRAGAAVRPTRERLGEGDRRRGRAGGRRQDAGVDDRHLAPIAARAPRLDRGPSRRPKLVTPSSRTDRDDDLRHRRLPTDVARRATVCAAMPRELDPASSCGIESGEIMPSSSTGARRFVVTRDGVARRRARRPSAPPPLHRGRAPRWRPVPQRAPARRLTTVSAPTSTSVAGQDVQSHS